MTRVCECLISKFTRRTKWTGKQLHYKSSMESGRSNVPATSAGRVIEEIQEGRCCFGSHQVILRHRNAEIESAEVPKTGVKRNFLEKTCASDFYERSLHCRDPHRFQKIKKTGQQHLNQQRPLSGLPTRTTPLLPA